MADLFSVSTPTEAEVLVAFSDLTNFSKFSRTKSDREVFEIMDAYFEHAGRIIAGGGGKIVKCIGDAALIVFPGERAGDGVRALMKLRDEGDSWMEERKIPCRHGIKAHFGNAVCGPVGPESEKQFDLYGQAVNTAATLESRGLAISQQAFRRLDAETRSLFKKNTPPVTYIPR